LNKALIMPASTTVNKQSVSHRRNRSGAVSHGHAIGISYSSWLDAEKLIKRGLPFVVIERLAETAGMTLERIKQVVQIPSATFLRRRQRGRLTPGESERVLRLARIVEQGMNLFHDDLNNARQWLDTPLPALNGRSPIDLAGTDVGAREVEDLIGRIQHGVLS
jgi:putative toxin-antitoxin system antitoxin component (TIGR02293 family)